MSVIRRALPLLVILLASCSASQTIVLESDGSGTAEVEVTIEPLFARYLEDLTLVAGGDEVLFTAEGVAAAINARPGLTALSVEQPSSTELNVRVGFENIAQLITTSPRDIGRYIRFEPTASFRRLSASIDGGAIRTAALIAGVQPLVVDAIVPENLDMTGPEYRDYLGWALEEYEQDRPLEDVLNSARVTTRIEVAGRIVQTSGLVRTGNAVEFAIPLIETITAERPQRVALVFER